MKLFNLQKYAFTKNFFEERGYNDDNKKATAVKATAVKATAVKATANTPTHYKSLFWTFFTILKGDNEYHLHQNNLFKIKNEFSMKFVETLKNEKVFMKQYKIKFHDVEASLLYNKDIDLATLRALALFYKINLVFIINNRYYFIEHDASDENEELHLIHQNRYKITYEKIKRIEKDEKTYRKLYMEGTRTTLKAPGSYKLDELKEICSILGINSETTSGKKKTKQQLYDDIIIKID
jgi:hypothetical protein